jgi:membrane fusion protein (multidrug efflux system)
MKKVLLFAVVLLITVGAVGGFAYFEYVMKPKMVQQAMAAATAQPPATVSLAPAKSENWRSGVPAIGTLSAVQGIQVSSEASGIVQRIGFDSGQEVEEGTLLVELDIATEEADLKAAEAQAKKSRLDLKRQRELLSRGNTTEQSFDAAVAQRDSDAAQVERIRAQIAEKSILAPFGGRLGIRLVDIGQYVSPGQNLVELVQLDPIYVDFPLPEQQVADLAVGDDVEAKLDAFPGETFAGKVTALDAQVNAETRNILVRAELANADHRLLPGMYANVRVLAPQRREVVTVPRTAVSYSLYGDTVFVAVPAEGQGGQGGQGGESGRDDAQGSGQASGQDGGSATGYKLERRNVTLGETREDRISILEGVSAGEQVVTAGQNKLYPGQSVTVSDKPALQTPSQRPRS